MIILIERYCKTCIFVIFIYKSKQHLYVHLKNTFNSFIIDSNFDLCLLLIACKNVISNFMIFIFHLIHDHFLIIIKRNKKESERKLNWSHQVESSRLSQVLDSSRLDSSQNSWFKYLSCIEMFNSSIQVESENWNQVSTWNFWFDSSKHEDK